MSSRAQLIAMREVRILDFCITRARQIMVELPFTAGDHSEDVVTLSEMVDRWQSLREQIEHEEGEVW